MRHRGFSLVELLVVVAIVVILVALLLSGVQKVRESANRMTCQNNAKQMVIALHQVHDTRGRLPSGIKNPRGQSSMPAAGWQIPILPAMELSSVYSEVVSEYQRTIRFDDRELNSYPHTGMGLVIRPYLCPSDPRVHKRYLSSTLGFFVAFTSYVGNCGVNCRQPNGMLFMDSAVAFRDVTDGLSNTILIGERPPSSSREIGWWYAGVGQDGYGSAEMILGVREPFTGEVRNSGPCEKREYEFSSGRFSNPCDVFHYWSPHPGGAFFGFSDGSVRFTRYEARPQMTALSTKAGHESITSLE